MQPWSRGLSLAHQRKCVFKITMLCYYAHVWIKKVQATSRRRDTQFFETWLAQYDWWHWNLSFVVIWCTTLLCCPLCEHQGFQHCFNDGLTGNVQVCIPNLWALTNQWFDENTYWTTMRSRRPRMRKFAMIKIRTSIRCLFCDPISRDAIITSEANWQTWLWSELFNLSKSDTNTLSPPAYYSRKLELSNEQECQANLNLTSNRLVQYKRDTIFLIRPYCRTNFSARATYWLVNNTVNLETYGVSAEEIARRAKNLFRYL